MASDRKAGAAQFPTTHWSLVDAIRQGDAGVRRQALERFLVCYLPALRVHLVRTRGVFREDSEDVLQDFVAQRVLEKDLVARVERGAGRLRTFLLMSLDHFLIDRLRQQRARKRSPGSGRLVPIDDQQDRLATAPAPSDLFDVAWARNVIAEALRRMQAQCEASGRHDLWGVFQCRLVQPLLTGAPPLRYERLVEQFHLTSPAQASNVLISAKRMYARTLRAVVAEYASDAEDTEAELRDLRGILAKCAGSS